jgi:hypothetical protein
VTNPSHDDDLVFISTGSLPPGIRDTPGLLWRRAYRVVIIIVIVIELGSWTPEQVIAAMCAMTGILALLRARERPA